MPSPRSYLAVLSCVLAYSAAAQTTALFQIYRLPDGYLTDSAPFSNSTTNVANSSDENSTFSQTNIYDLSAGSGVLGSHIDATYSYSNTAVGATFGGPAASSRVTVLDHVVITGGSGPAMGRATVNVSGTVSYAGTADGWTPHVYVQMGTDNGRGEVTFGDGGWQGHVASVSGSVSVDFSFVYGESIIFSRFLDVGLNFSGAASPGHPYNAHVIADFSNGGVVSFSLFDLAGHPINDATITSADTGFLYSPVAIPEPASGAIYGGLACLAATVSWRRKRRPGPGAPTRSGSAVCDWSGH